MKFLGFLLVVGVVVFATFEVVGFIRDLKARKDVKNSAEKSSNSAEDKKKEN